MLYEVITGRQRQLAAHARVEGLGAGGGGVGLGADRQHRHHVAHRGKAVQRLAAYAAGRGIGRGKFGMLGFERLQFA